jgi:hypothetical protein
MKETNCPWCDFKTNTRLPRKVPLTKFSPAHFWTGFKFGAHAVRSHPLKYDQFRDKEPLRFLEWYIAQPEYSLQEEYRRMEAEEIIEELGEEQVRQDIIRKFD